MSYRSENIILTAILIWTMILFYFSPLHAQNEKYRMEQIPLTGELLNFSGTCLLQDVEGFMWFGSTDGLFRYDGKEFKRYQNHPFDGGSLFGHHIIGIVEDTAKSLWVATRVGLNRYDKYLDKFDRYRICTQITSITADDEGNIWIGTYNQGLFKISANTDSISKYTLPEFFSVSDPVSIDCLLLDSSGFLWIQFGDSGICRFNCKSASFERIWTAPHTVRNIYEDKAGRLLIASYFGLYLLNRQTGSFDLQLNEPGIPDQLGKQMVRTLMEDDSGNMWIRTFKGIYKYSSGGKLLFFWKYPEIYSMQEPYWSLSTSLYEDRAGTIWFLTREGIHKLIKRETDFTIYNWDPPITNLITGLLLVNNDSLLICSSTGGSYAYNLHQGNVKKFDLMESEYAFLDSHKAIWVRTNNGLIRILNPFGQTPEFKRYLPIPGDKSSLPARHIWDFFEDSDGRFWVACWGAMPCYYDRENDCFIRLVNNPDSKDSLPPNQSIRHESTNRELWAVRGGVYKIIPPFIRVSEHTVMPTDVFEYVTNELIDVFEDSSRFFSSVLDNKGILWLGEVQMGLFKLNTDKREMNISPLELVSYQNSDGLSSNRIRCLQEDHNGYLWLGTENGLSKFDPESETFSNFYMQNGLPSNRFKEVSTKSRKGEMFFSTRAGAISFYPDSIRINTRIPVVKLTDFKVHNQVIIPSESSILKKAVRFTNEVKLKYNQNTLTLSFAALNYIQPELNQYKYMLEGLDQDWVYSGSRNSVTYAGLKSGSYVFRATGSNNDGIWNEEGATLSVYIQPPPWLSWWAYTCYFLLLSGIGILIWRYLVNRAKMHTALEIERIEKENVRELDHMKSRFFANISHEFRTPLTLIEGPVNDLLKSEGGLINQERQLLTLVKRNSRKLHRLINQLLEISKLEKGRIKLEVSKGDLSGFLRSIALSYLSLAERHGIRYQVEVNNYPEPFLFDRDKLEKITTNLLSNAFKFTPHGGSVRLSLIYLPNPTTGLISYAKIIVSDTGPGIPAKEQDKVFDRFYQVLSHEAKYTEGTGIGLALVKELVDLYRGEIQLESNTGIGSTFSVILPVSRNSFKADEIVETPSGISEDMVKETMDLEEDSENSEMVSGKVGEDVPEILIVEDNTDLRYYMKQHLASEYRVCEAENGMEGLSAAIEFLPDLVITDLMMPIMDGREMCKRLKNDERTSHIPIIILTAKADKKSKMEGLETGADDYLFKPFDMEELKVRTRNLIQQREKLREKFKREFITMPKDPKSISPGDKLLLKIINVLHQNLEDPEFNIENIFTELHISRAQLFRKVQAMTSFTPKELLRNLRLKKAASLFDSGYDNVTQVMFAVGFNNHSHFAKCFRDLYGENPSAYKKRLVK